MNENTSLFNGLIGEIVNENTSISLSLTEAVFFIVLVLVEFRFIFNHSEETYMKWQSNAIHHL